MRVEGPMRHVGILHLITELEIGGAEKLLLSLIKNIDRRKFNVTVGYLTGSGTLVENFSKVRINVVHFKMACRYDWTVIFQLAHFIKKKKISIVHTHLIQADIYGFLAAKMVGVPIIVSTKHNLDEFRKKCSPSIWLDRLTANSSNKVIAVSSAVRDFLIKRERISPDKFTVVHNGVDLKEFIFNGDIEQNRQRLNLSGPIVGTVARLDIQKGHKYLLDAVPRVLRRIPDVQFLIVGDGSLRKELEDKSIRLGVQDRVIFTGIYPQITKILAAIDIFVLPSLWEGLGIVLLEAMAMRKPVVATAVDGIPEVVTNGETGILVSPKESNALADAIIRLLQNKEEARRMGFAGRERVEKYFTIELMVKDIEAIYEELLLIDS